MINIFSMTEIPLVDSVSLIPENFDFDQRKILTLLQSKIWWNPSLCGNLGEWSKTCRYCEGHATAYLAKLV